MVGNDGVKYAEVVEPLVDQLAKEMQSTDYKFTKIELDKQACLSCQKDAQDAINMLIRKNDKLWEKIMGLKKRMHNF